jgi:integrase
VGLYRRRESRSKGRIWWISYYFGGKQRRESSGSTNKRVAEKLLALRKAQVFEDRWSLPKSHTPKFADFAKQFLESIAHDDTRSRYKTNLDNISRYLGPTIRLSEITAERIYGFQQARLSAGLGKATINRDTAALSSMLSRARRLRLIQRNPCSDVPKLNERRERRQAKPFTYEEEMRIKHFAVPWLSVLITLLVETGLRVKREALRLKWADVHLDDGPPCIHIRESKTVAGVRTVWLTQHCRDTLKEWQSLLGSQRSPYVFPSPRREGNHMTDYKKPWQNAVRDAGIQGRRIYDFRASFASRANACQASNLTLAHLLGHASTQILPTYVKPLDENTRAIISALDSARAAQTYRLGLVQ